MNDTSKMTRSATGELLRRIELEMFKGPAMYAFISVLEKVCSKRFHKQYAGIANSIARAPTLGIEAMLSKVNVKDKYGSNN